MKRTGFTLIELMLVVGIIGVLASIAIPSYSKYKENVKNMEADIVLGSLARGAQAYFAEERQTFRNVDSSVETNCIAGTSSVPTSEEIAAVGEVWYSTKLMLDFGSNQDFEALGVSGTGAYYHAFMVNSLAGSGGYCIGTGPTLPNGGTAYILMAIRPDSGRQGLVVGVVALVRKGQELMRTPGVQWWGPMSGDDLGTVFGAYNPWH